MGHIVPGRRRTCHRPIGGFTLIELLMAVTVLVVGLLALVSSSAVVVRLITGGAQLASAAELARSRFDILRSAPCPSRSAGSTSTAWIDERWSVVPSGAYAVDVVEDVAYATPRGVRSRSVRSMVAC